MEEYSPSDETQKQKAKDLLALLSGSLASSVANLCGRSRAIPSDKDFHFYNNFDEFKLPSKELALKAESSLRSIASSSEALLGIRKQPPVPTDPDEAYDWLVNLNDEFLERVAGSLDEFKSLREKAEENGEKTGAVVLLEGGFQLVCGKNKKKGTMDNGGKDEGCLDPSSSLEVKIASKDNKTMGTRSKVPFHIPTIPRPQDEFSILVNNKNQPFEHVWLERSEDGSRFVHPLEKLSVSDFIDRNVEEDELVKPLPVEVTPFKLVEGVKELKELAAKLRDVNEFAVDLEHNQYRSFQGLTCLMQISTRTEDFIVDTLKLRVHIGPYLREVFKDPSKRKVMHGADRDMVWLQRDFGIYVCNLFDTGQASRVMQLERNSLEYLLHHFCEVDANKEYQNADWRLRPLPNEMVKYAREDTHYLLYIYDVMRRSLVSASSDENDLLLEVYQRSYDVCIHLYEKELLTDTSYLYIYGLPEADFNSEQLAIVAGLCAWRDKVAREEDESTGYILPNKALLEIARQMPLSSGKLRRLVKSKHALVERHLGTVINIIRHSVENSSAFESISEQLKKSRLEVSSMQSIEVSGNKSGAMPATDDPLDSTVAERDVLDVVSDAVYGKDDSVVPANTEFTSGQVASVKQEEKLVITEKENMDNRNTATKKASIASVQISKKTTCAFGALLGNSSSRRKLNPDKGSTIEQNKNENKVEQIKSTVTLPFHSFSGRENPSGPRPTESIEHPEPEIPQPSEMSRLEEVIPLENDGSDNSRSSTESAMAEDGALMHREWFPSLPENGRSVSQPESEMVEEPVSLSDLSASFEQCFQSINERRASNIQNQRQSEDPGINFQVRPFDYAAARKNIKFVGVGKEDRDGEGCDEGVDDKTCSDRRDKHRGRGRGQSGGRGRGNGDERTGGFQPPRRRQAFPPSGNRSTTYH